MASKHTGHFLSVTEEFRGAGESDGIITMEFCGFKVFFRLAVGSVTVLTTVTSSKTVKFLEFRKFLFLDEGWDGEEVMGRGIEDKGSGEVKLL